MANPDPSPETRFKPGQTGNPGGKTAEHRKAEVEAAEIAARLSLRMVKALEAELDKLEGGDEPRENAATGAIKGDILRLMKDVQDRAFGMPTAPTTIGNPDGTPLARNFAVLSLEELEALEKIARKVEDEAGQ